MPAIDIEPLSGRTDDYDRLLELIGDAPIVMVGEASHGTHEFYRERAMITRRLIAERGFTAVAVEADWPDAYRVNRFVRGADDDRDAEEALRGFMRFPTWMWRNAEVLDFIGWLRDHNDRCAGEGLPTTGFYGLDLYSLITSVGEVIRYLDGVDPEASKRARDRYACFDQYGYEQRYGRAASLGVSEPCRQEVVEQLVELRQSADSYLRRDGIVAEDEQFYAEQNARLIANAEEYYRAMFADHSTSWNLRDRHMAETLGHLRDHLSRHGSPSKVVVWEHNSHVGDAKKTDMRKRDQLNLGQLARERWNDDVFLIGFTTYSGTVTAASEWEGPAERKRVRPALPGSIEALLHEAGHDRFMIDLTRRAPGPLAEERLERAIGVIYRPETERISHYMSAFIAGQFDAVIHIDHTRAVEPLERTAGWEAGEPPETYPSAL